ncbi:MAG: DEAD/DEAH box helicase family protein, partial [Gemmataceae bacterium]
MDRATKTLRDYQEKLVFNVCRATGDVLVEQPTGSGKTVEIVTLIAMRLGKHFTHALIAAPQEQIEEGFVKRDYDTVAFRKRDGVAVPSLHVPNKPVHKSLIRAARESGNLGSVKRVVQYLRQPLPQDHAWACTHAALNRIEADDLPANLTGKALFIDEAHHASADGLSQIVTLWRERGGQLLFFTATPYRGDGRPVKLDGMRTYRRSLAEHMAEGFAPHHLDSEIVALGQ